MWSKYFAIYHIYAYFCILIHTGFCQSFCPTPQSTTQSSYWSRSCQGPGNTFCTWLVVSKSSTNPSTCCLGWKGAQCNIPVCNNPCSWTTGAKFVCNSGGCEPKVDPNSQWPINAADCTSTNNCFPGICTNKPFCFCAPGFEGAFCDEISEPPKFTSCTMSVFDSSGQVITNADCLQGTTYVQNGTFTFKWQVEQPYTESNVSLVPAPDYIGDGDCIDNDCWKVGIVESGGVITLVDNSGHVIVSKNFTCGVSGVTMGDSKTSPPRRHVTCTSGPITLDPSKPNQPNPNPTLNPASACKRYLLKISSSAGGYITVNFSPITSKDPTATVFKKFQRNTVQIQTTIIVLDGRRPVHCSERNSCSLQDQPPVYHNSDDFTKNATQQLGAFGWNENGTTGCNVSSEVIISSYTFTICPMETNTTTGVLKENIQSCLPPKVYNLNTPGSFPVVILPETNMYSLIVTFCDVLSSCAKARRLIFYDKDNNIGTTSNPIAIVLGELSGRFFNRNSGNVNLTWFNHFVNNKHSKMLGAVRPGSPGEFVIDVPNGPSTKALRSLDAIFNMNGIVLFEVSVGGGSFQQVKQGDQSASLTLPSGLQQDNSVTFSVRAWDIMNNSLTENFTAFFDATPPQIFANISITINDTNLPPDFAAFDASSIHIGVMDTTSGISEIKVFLFDNTDETMIPVQLSTPVFSISPIPTGNCTADPTSTYRTVSGDCYSKFQHVYFKHCDLFKRASYVFFIRLAVFNGAGIETDVTKQTQSISELSHYKSCTIIRTPPPIVITPGGSNNRLSPGAVAGIVIGIIVGVVLVILIIILVCRFCCHSATSSKGEKDYSSRGIQRVDGTAVDNSPRDYEYIKSKDNYDYQKDDNDYKDGKKNNDYTYIEDRKKAQFKTNQDGTARYIIS